MLLTMRTTLNLDDDVLETARTLAVRQEQSLGKVISGLLRRAVEPPVVASSERNGIPLFPVSQGARPVTPEVVSELLDKVP